MVGRHESWVGAAELVVALALSLQSVAMSAGEAPDWHARIVKALLADSREDEWAEGTLHELAKAIVTLVEQKKAARSDEQFRDICAGLPGWIPAKGLRADYHPLRREYFKQLTLYAVANYLAFGGADPTERQKYLSQVRPLVEEWKEDLLKKHPDAPGIVLRAVERVIKGEEMGSANPLRRGRKRSVGGAALAEARRAWKQLLKTLQADRNASASRRKGQFISVMSSALAAVWASAEGPKLPRPPAFLEARRALLDNANAEAVELWEDKARAERFRRYRERAMQKALLKGPSKGLYPGLSDF